MDRFRVSLAISLLAALACNAAGSTPDPTIILPTLTPERVATLPPPTATASQQPTEVAPPFELAPIGAYEVITHGGETTLHVWVEFLEDCHQVGEPSLLRDGYTFDVVIPMVRLEGDVCTQGWFPTEVNIPLDTSGLAPGTYTIVVNGNAPNSLKWLFADITPTPPAGCPIPTEDTALFVAEAQDYCVLMPAGWQPRTSGYRSPLLTGGNEPVTVSLSFLADMPAEGRTADEAVDEVLSEMVIDERLSLERTIITLDGERMVLVRGIPSRGEEFDWWVIHNDKVYYGSLAFRNFGPAAPHFDTAFDLFIRTLHWLN